MAARVLERDDMRLLGVERTSRIGRWSNRSRQRFVEDRRRAYEEFEELLAENGWPGGERRIALEDGFAIDRSGTLPFTEQLIAEMEPVIEERGLKPWLDQGKPFLQNLLPADGVARYPSLLDFGTSSVVLAAVAEPFGFVPHLSSSLPRGIRLQESSIVHDPTPLGPWRDSQLWHLDYHTFPTLYVITLIREVTEESGPFTFVSASVSARVANALGYRSRRCPYRLDDELFFSLVDPSEVYLLTGSPGTTLFIESASCFHMGSRNAVVPRHQVQYAYASPIKNDFGFFLRPQVEFPVREGDSRLRRMVCDRNWQPDGRTA
jgi:hypothetical protein